MVANDGSATANIMVVAHTDDEVLWGGKALEQGRWKVVVVTGGHCPQRVSKFLKVMALYGAEGEVWDFPDKGGEPFTSSELEEIRNKLERVLRADDVGLVATHGPTGEYGHAAHVDISKIVASLLPHRSNLQMFSPSPPPLVRGIMRGNRSFRLSGSRPMKFTLVMGCTTS